MANYGDAEILTLLQTDLGKINASTQTVTYLTTLIGVARKAVETEGMTIDETSIEDAIILEMYAAYLYRKRAETDNAMPRMLRWMLNNRIMKEQGSGT